MQWIVVANSKLGWLWLVIHLEPGLFGGCQMHSDWPDGLFLAVVVGYRAQRTVLSFYK